MGKSHHLENFHPKQWSLIDISETHSHYFISLDFEETLGEEVLVELNEEELIIRGSGIPLSQGDSPRCLTLKSYSNQEIISAAFRDGKLFLALPKVTRSSIKASGV